MVWAALAAIGAGAAEALSSTRDLGDVATAQACLARNGISVSGGIPTEDDVPVYRACAKDYNRVRALTTLTGAATLPVAAWLLMLLGGSGTRWQLRSGRLAGVPAAAAGALTGRFAELCDSQGLTGRHRPRLVLAPPATGVGQAFTTGLPGTRPWVVVPLAYAYAERAAFDAVALHELGHVRARDVLWASAVWWAGWLAVPALVLALFPLFATPQVVWEFYGQAVLVAFVAALSMFVLRAALLRRRELAADHHVLEVTADPGTLAAVVRTAERLRPAGLLSRVAAGVRRVFATHPVAADRLGAGVDTRGWEGGFVFTTAVGVVAMATYHSLHAVLDNLRAAPADTVPTASVALAAAALLWASVVVPAWTRRAALTSYRWTGPWAGAVVGLVVGYCLQPPGATPGVIGFYAPSLPLLAGCLAVAALAVGVLTAGVATRLAVPVDSALRRRSARVGAVLVVAVALATIWNVVVETIAAYVLTHDVPMVRRSLLWPGNDEVWRYTPVLLLVGLALVVLRGRLRFRRVTVAITGVAAVVGGAAATSSWLLRVRVGQSDDANYYLGYQAWWVCAFAGLVAAVAVVAANRGRAGATLGELPCAVLCGLLAAALAGALRYGAVRIGGYLPDSNLFHESLQVPGSLLFVVLVATVPLTLPLVAAMTRREPRRGAGLWAAGAGGVTVLLALVLVGGGLSAVTVAEQDGTRPVRIIGTREPQVPAPVTPGDHERPLDQEAVTAALAGLPALLPPGAKNVPNAPEEHITVVPAACDAAIKRSTAVEKSWTRNADARHTYEFPAEGTFGANTISVSVRSYETPPPGFADVDAESRECADFRIPRETAESGYVDAHTNPRPVPDLPYEARRWDISLSWRFKGDRLTVLMQQFVALVGHNRVAVTVTWGFRALPPPQATLQQLDDLLKGAMNVVVGKL